MSSSLSLFDTISQGSIADDENSDAPTGLLLGSSQSLSPVAFLLSQLANSTKEHNKDDRDAPSPATSIPSDLANWLEEQDHDYQNAIPTIERRKRKYWETVDGDEECVKRELLSLDDFVPSKRLRAMITRFAKEIQREFVKSFDSAANLEANDLIIFKEISIQMNVILRNSDDEDERIEINVKPEVKELISKEKVGSGDFIGGEGSVGGSEETLVEESEVEAFGGAEEYVGDAESSDEDESEEDKIEINPDDYELPGLAAFD